MIALPISIINDHLINRQQSQCLLYPIMLPSIRVFFVCLDCNGLFKILVVVVRIPRWA